MKFLTPFLVALLPLTATFIILDLNLFGDSELALFFLLRSAFSLFGFATTLITIISCASVGGLLAKPLDASAGYMIYAGAVVGIGVAMSLTALWGASLAALPI